MPGWQLDAIRNSIGAAFEFKINPSLFSLIIIQSALTHSESQLGNQNENHVNCFIIAMVM